MGGLGFGALLSLAGGALKTVGGLFLSVWQMTPLPAKTAILTALAMLVFYEGLPLRLMDGRVDRVVAEQRRLCEADKERSAKQAREDDQARQQERTREFLDQIRQANERAESAKQRLDQYVQENADEDAAAAAAGTPNRCAPSPRGLRRLSPADLPYPGADAPRN